MVPAVGGASADNRADTAIEKIGSIFPSFMIVLLNFNSTVRLPCNRPFVVSTNRRLLDEGDVVLEKPGLQSSGIVLDIRRARKRNLVRDDSHVTGATRRIRKADQSRLEIQTSGQRRDNSAAKRCTGAG